MVGIIYLLTSPSGKQYVGQTIKPFKNRLKTHESCKRDYPINRAFKKYGIENFKKEIIITVETDEGNLYNQLNKLERYFIKLYNTFGKPGYNANDGGRHYKLSEESKLKISIKKTGIKHSPESILSSSIKCSKPIIQYDLKGVFIKEWKSCREVYKETNIFHNSVGRVCRGERKTAGGFIWKYKNNNINYGNN